MNADDIGTTSNFIKKHIVVLSAIDKNESKGLQAWIHILENSDEQKNRNLRQEQIVISKQIAITSDFDIH